MTPMINREELEAQLIDQVRKVLSTPGLHPSVYDMYSEYLSTGDLLDRDILPYPILLPLYQVRLQADLRYALLALDSSRNDVFFANLAEMEYDLARAKEQQKHIANNE